MYVITGATGNIGSKITTELLEKGKKVKAIVRDLNKAKSLQDKGAELAKGDLSDTNFLTNAIKGATAVFAMIPPNYAASDFRKYMNGIADSLVTAIKNSGVKNVIALSSVGAHLPENNGIVQGLYDFEQKLNQLKDVNILVLRPGYFMENLFGSIPLIKNMGINGSGLKKDVPFALVATKDIAHKATEKFLSLDFKGTTVQYILGPKELTNAEITSILGKAISKPELPYVEFKYEDFTNALVQAGFSESNAKAMAGLQKSMNEGIFMPKGIRNAESTTPTSLEEFSKVFAQVYNQSAAVKA
jgi:uncharacterized protein YbjT (DUF2867 family)